MSSNDFNCVFQTNSTARNSSKSKIRTVSRVVSHVLQKLDTKVRLKSTLSAKIKSSVRVSCSPSIRATLNTSQVAVSARIHDDFKLNSNATKLHSAKSRIHNNAKVDVKFTDKIGGDLTQINKFDNFLSTQRLYPTGDVASVLGSNPFINESQQASSLFSSIDEGIFTGNYNENFNSSTRISDDIKTFIQPSGLGTSGTFRYKCEVTSPLASPKENFLFIRASAPTYNFASNAPPAYKFHNIFFNDSSGNLITQYEDMTIRGDSDYRKQDKNFSTYIFSPKINNAKKRSTDPDFPNFLNEDGYSLSFDVEVQCKDTSFSSGFSSGYIVEDCNLPDVLDPSGNDYLASDGSPLSTQSQHFLNPTYSIRISALEIVSSGNKFGFNSDDDISCFVQTDPSGYRITREIRPSEVQLSSFDTGIYPTVTSTWQSNDNAHDNSTSSGCKELLKIIRQENTDKYLDLDSSTVADSGKLILKFSHEPPISQNRNVAGAFDIGYLNAVKEFDSSTFETVHFQDSVFKVDEVYLKIVAKKDTGSSDYTLDLVGYSFDHLLHNTPAVNGFLQNEPGGTGSIPPITSTTGVDSLSMSAESLSDKGQIVVRPVTVSDGGDHYLLATSPVVDSTTFKEYIVPLRVYKQSHFGIIPDYEFSSFFENLFIDICPLPDNASIASLSLIVTHKPSDGIHLHTIGHDNGIDLGSVNSSMFVSDRKSVDQANNAGSVLSDINNIPHGYGSPNTLKTNYSRRWRGVDGLVTSGPYNSNEFSFSFDNPVLETPFFGGYFSFNNDSGSSIISDDMPSGFTALQGTYNGTYTKTHNIGSRFKSASLFGLTTGHTTIDFTAMSGYSNHALYGQIADSYDNALKVSGSTGYISFPDFDIHNGFIIFFRFSPDENMDFNSSTLFAKDDQISVGFVNNKLRVTVTDSTLTTQTIEDTIDYDDYSYPLSIMVTYVDNVLSLYVDNELDSHNFTRLRDSLTLSGLPNFSNALTFGYNPGDSTGFSGYITDIAISASSLNTDFGSANQFAINANSFFNTIHNKYWADGESYVNDTVELYDYINTNTASWTLGDFQSCQFSSDFYIFTEKVGTKFLTHSIESDGTSYDSACDLTLPTNVDTNTSYHTQIENDFIRFNLIDVPDSFMDEDVVYALRPRIQKTLPRGYNFMQDSVYVDTIIEHKIDSQLTWSDGSVGGKLIVSLYTPNKDNELLSLTNPGLINRCTHYLSPDMCVHKISSKFKFADLINTGSEDWSKYDQSLNTTEFYEKYFADDVQKMFLQYDIVYPSGTAYHATVTIFAATVKFTRPLHKARTISNL